MTKLTPLPPLAGSSPRASCSSATLARSASQSRNGFGKRTDRDCCCQLQTKNGEKFKIYYLGRIGILMHCRCKNRDCSIHIVISIIQNEKSVNGELGIRNLGRRMVGTDETMEPWGRHKFRRLHVVTMTRQLLCNRHQGKRCRPGSNTAKLILP